MCGITGLFAKTAEIEAQLGSLLADMLGQLADRGPDSAGIAIYRDPAPPDAVKLSLRSSDREQDWNAVRALLEDAGGLLEGPVRRGSHALFVVSAPDEGVRDLLADAFPHIRVMSAGRSIEIYKEAGPPVGVLRGFGADALEGSHALGHTRMATESMVTTEHSHPFSTGPDLCLVHNGSLSNHNRLRRTLRRRGVEFATDNDSEVAAGYLTWRLHEGDDFVTALESCLTALDGFYTLAVGTEGGFAVLRDPIACKPAVLAETDEWVAMASEYRAIAALPGAEHAKLWEPDPGKVYHWARERVG